jgi:proteasome lid subunit RPN8/RPN11
MQIASSLLDDIRRHGIDTYPEECCGFLLGHVQASGNEIRETRAVENRHAGDRSVRYSISPEDYREAERYAEQHGMDVVGFYHSHPDHPAQPSPRDLDEATFPWYTYVIVSVRDGAARELTAWTLGDDRSRFLEDRDEVLDES